MRRAERGRAGQQSGDSVQINELLRARLGPVLHMKALGKWTLDLSGSWIRSDDLICLRIKGVR